MPSNELPTWDQLRAKAHYSDDQVVLFHADCLAVLPTLPDNSVDAVCTDPPYGLEFMGKEWDAPWKSSDNGVHANARIRRADEVTPKGQAHSTSAGPYLAAAVNKFAAGLPFQQWCQLWAAECLRVLKPGGHLLAFGGTRTWHRLAVAIEDAGFELRDSIAWLYGSGFPKSLAVDKAIDRAAGAERERVTRIGGKTGSGALNSGTANGWAGTSPDSETASLAGSRQVDDPITADAQRWQGWGTALKPAHEPIVVARKPLVGGTVAANVLAHGTGALNIDATRIGWDPEALAKDGARRKSPRTDITGGRLLGSAAGEYEGESASPAGRWPANVTLDETAAAALDQMSGEQRDGIAVRHNGVGESNLYGAGMGALPVGTNDLGYGAGGGASRFFYTAKAGADERITHDGISHPTVKPLALMRWLVRLVTPPGGLILEPFAGSGTTIEAALIEGFRCVAIEREADYLPLILKRIRKDIQGVIDFNPSGAA